MIPARALWTALIVAAVGALLLVTGCTATQRTADAAALARFEQQAKADAQKAQAILGAISANGVQLAECGASIVASTAAAIATGNYLGLLSGWACIVPAAIKLRDDIEAGLAKLPPLDALQLAQQVHAAALIAKTIIAPVISTPPPLGAH